MSTARSVAARLACGAGGAVAHTTLGVICAPTLGAASSAAASAIGAAVLKASGYDHYPVGHAAASGAIGGAILGVASGPISGCVRGLASGLGMYGFGSNANRLIMSATNCAFLLFDTILFLLKQPLATMIGDQILKAGEDSAMSVGNAAAAGATGGAIMFGGMLLILPCLIVGLSLVCLLASCCLGVGLAAAAASSDRNLLDNLEAKMNSL